MKLTKKIFDELKIYYKILNNCNDGINVTDTEGILIYVNQVSADYAGQSKESMIGNNINNYYKDAVLLDVLKDKHAILDKKIHYVGNKKYLVSSYPLQNNGVFLGAFSVFKDIQEIGDLNAKIKQLELQLDLNKHESNITSIIGFEGSLKSVLKQARRTVGSLGGPRHSVISGESGTGKTMLANLIYEYAKQVGVIKKDAPFIEVNCAQFTNPDIAAMEIFGSEDGAYTGSKKKRGLFEEANGGILFLDEAHTLENYQNMLLKAIESGKIRRIGGSKEINIDVIIIAASTKNLKDVLLPELYQRLGQYEMYLPSLRERSLQEKENLFNYFIKNYEDLVKKHQDIKYNVIFTREARDALLKAKYPRNIRQLRDIINHSIDSASPLIEELKNKEEITTIVGINNIPFEISEDNTNTTFIINSTEKITPTIEKRVLELNSQGLGPRRISSKLKSEGYEIKYYKIAYFLKNNKKI